MSGIDEQIADAVLRRLQPTLERMERMISTGSAHGADELLTVKQAASLAKVRPATVRRWIREGLLTPRGRARGLRVSRAQLLSIPAEPPRPADTKSESAKAKASRLLGGH